MEEQHYGRPGEAGLSGRPVVTVGGIESARGGFIMYQVSIPIGLCCVFPTCVWDSLIG